MDIVVVGAGLSGLACAVDLKTAGHSVAVVEASDGPGGRVRTDTIDGHLCDRGFQILLTAYPDAADLLDYAALELKTFKPGAQVLLLDGQTALVGDPFRALDQLIPTVLAPIGSLRDKARILAYRMKTTRGTIEELWDKEDVTARTRFKDLGFSPKMIERFLQPLFAGITLDPDLGGSSRVVDFVFRMLAEGDAAVPRYGMGQISEQLAGRLDEGELHLNTKVVNVEAKEVTILGGETFDADAVVVATGPTEAARLTDVPDPGWRGVTSIWFSAAEPASTEPILLLNGTGKRPLNSIVNMSAVSAAYSPAGTHTVVVSAPTVAQGTEAALRAQLRDLVGPVTDAWETLRVDRIPQAQPLQLPGYDKNPPVQLENGVYICGDHRHDASINGAILSGRKAAAAIG
ncbi:MAG: FAD-dependent oxidoreductase [Acidimicrobiales bacterium]|nr:FAD-dependent oxidoreductase [Acidimicrobiales bacterium]